MTIYERSEHESDNDRAAAAVGSLILNRLVPAPDHGAGWKRDPETGFVYYSSEWLGDTKLGDSESLAILRRRDDRGQA